LSLLSTSKAKKIARILLWGLHQFATPCHNIFLTKFRFINTTWRLVASLMLEAYTFTLCIRSYYLLLLLAYDTLCVRRSLCPWYWHFKLAQNKIFYWSKKN
jgi:hypothetical protein